MVGPRDERYETFTEVVDELGNAVRRAIDTREVTGCGLPRLLGLVMEELAFEWGGIGALMDQAGWSSNGLVFVLAAVEPMASEPVS